MAGRGLGFVFSFAVPLVLVRALDQAAFGQYKQYFLIATMVSQVAALGLPWSLHYFLPGGGDRRGRYITTTVAILGLVGVLILVLGNLFGPALAHWMRAPALARIMPLLSVYTMLMLLTLFAEDLAVIEQRPKTAGLVAFSSEVLRAVLLIGAVLIWGTLAAIGWASVVYGLFRLVFLAIYAVYLYRGSLLQFGSADVGNQLRYAVPFGLAMIVQGTSASLHQYFVAGVSNPATFAIYAVGCFRIPVANLLYAAVADVALVRVTKHYRSGKQDGAFKLYRDVLRFLGVTFVPSYIFIFTFASSVIEVLFTSKYLAATPVLIVFAMSLFLFVPADHVVLRAYSQTQFIFRANLVGLVVQCVLLFPLYRAFGIVGAAAAFVIGLSVTRVTGLFRSCRLLSESVVSVFPLRAIMVSAACALVAAAVSHALTSSLSPFLRLLLGAAGFAVVYLVLAWRFGVVELHEKKWLRRQGMALARRKPEATG